jgi:tetratricopeptide (TPR) repeat protein
MSADPAWKALEAQAQAARASQNHAAALEAFLGVAALLPQAAWVQVQIGTEHQSLGDDAAAADAFTKALDLEPGNLYARNGLAKQARARGEHEAALALFKDIMSLAPEAEWAAVEAAATLVALGRREEAQEAYAALLARAPGNAYALLGLGKLTREAGRWLAGLELFQAACQAAPDNPWPCLEYGDTLLTLGRVDDAEQAYQNFERLGGEAYLAALAFGRCARARGDGRATLAWFSQACLLAPQNLWALLARATEEREQGLFEAARISARLALVRHRHDPLPWRNLGETELRAGQLAAADQVLSEAIGLIPANPGLLTDKARIEGQMGRLEIADKLLAEALDLDPCNLAALALQAEHDQQRDDAVVSLTRYQAALTHQPANLLLRIGSLKARGLAGNLQEALSGLAELAASGALIPELYLAWSLLAREAGDLTLALNLMHEATVKFPGNFWLVVERMQAALLVGRQDVELDFLRRVRARSLSEHAYRHLFLGRFAERTAQLDNALRHYQAATRANPQDITAHIELARVKIIRLDLDGARHHLKRITEINPGAILRRGGSLNISQSHLGQILDEYALDHNVLSQLRALSTLSPLHRAQALCLLVSTYPDNVAIAITLLIALREGGRLDQITPRAMPLAIPAVIAQFWDEDTPPRDVCQLMESWSAQNPDHQVQRFSLASAKNFLHQHYPKSVVQAFARRLEPAQRADLFRLAWLYKSGGIYSDADDRCRAPLAKLLPPGADLVLYQEEYGTLGNNFIATAPGNPVIHMALQEAVMAINRGDSDTLWLATGPGLLTRALARQIGDQTGASLPAGTAVLQRHELSQVISPHCKVGYKKTPQHWTKASFGAHRPRSHHKKQDGF